MSSLFPDTLPVLRTGKLLKKYFVEEWKEGCEEEREAGSMECMTSLCAQATVWQGNEGPDRLALLLFSFRGVPPLDPEYTHRAENETAHLSPTVGNVKMLDGSSPTFSTS